MKKHTALIILAASLGIFAAERPPATEQDAESRDKDAKVHVATTGRLSLETLSLSTAADHDIKLRKAVQEDTTGATLSASPTDPELKQIAGRYELFEPMHRFLLDYIREVSAIVKRNNLTEFSYEWILDPAPCHQKKSLELRIDGATPYALYTPWGEVRLPFFNDSHSLFNHLRCYQNFLQKMELSLLRVEAPSGSVGSWRSYYPLIDAHTLRTHFEPCTISEDGIKPKYMTQTCALILHSSLKNKTFYTVRMPSYTIETPLPLPGDTAQEEYRNFEKRYRCENWDS